MNDGSFEFPEDTTSIHKSSSLIGNGDARDAQCFRLFALGHTAPAPLVSTSIL